MTNQNRVLIFFFFFKTPVTWFGDSLAGIKGRKQHLTEHFILRMLFIILTTNYLHFLREANCLRQTLSCAALSWAVTPSHQPCLTSFRSLETCSSQLRSCLRNFHLLTTSSPSPASSRCLALFSLGPALPPWGFICLSPLFLSPSSHHRPWPLPTVTLYTQLLLVPSQACCFPSLCDLGQVS